MNKLIATIVFLCAAVPAPTQFVPSIGYLLVVDDTANAVHIYNTRTGTYAGDMVPPKSGFTPVSVAIGHQSQIYVGDSKGNIWQYAGPFSSPNATPLATVPVALGMSIAQGPYADDYNFLYAVTLPSPSAFGQLQFYTINEFNGAVYANTVSPNPPLLISGPAFFDPNSPPIYALYVGGVDRVQAFDADTLTLSGYPGVNGADPAYGSVTFTNPGSSNLLFTGATGATFDASGHLYVSGLTSGTAVAAIFEDQNLFDSAPAWRTVVSKLPSTTPLAFDSAGNLYAAYAANASTSYPLQQINPATGASTNIGPAGIIKDPIYMAWVQGFLIRAFPIFGGGVYGFLEIAPGASLHLAVTAVPAVATTASDTCPVTLQFTDTNGNVIATNSVSMNPGQIAALDYTNTTSSLQQARPALLIDADAPLEACGSALPSLTLTNGGTIVTVPPTVTGIPLFPPVGVPAGDNLLLSLTNDAVAPTPPDPCIVNISFVDANGNTIKTASATIAPGQTTGVSYNSPSTLPSVSVAATASLTSASMTWVRPVFQMTSGGLTCSALVPSLTIADFTGAPKAAFPPANPSCGAVPVF